MEPPLPDLPRHPLRIADLSTRRDTTFDLAPSAPEREAVAAALDIIGVKKLTFSGTLAPVERRDWRLEGTLGATVVQPCVVTLAPVTTRIDEAVVRQYMADLPAPTGGEEEMPEDDSIEELPATLDLAAVMIEALSLALPPFPRADGVALGEAVYADDGVTPLTDEDTKPFAGLAGLRDALSKKDD